MENNVIKFPIENKRADLSNIAIEPEEVFEKIRLMKKSYFSEVAETILDDVLRAVGCLDLEESKFPTHEPEHEDLIMIKESVISLMCRIVGIEHPLHEISKNEIIDTTITDDDGMNLYLGYKFKSDSSSSSPEVSEAENLS